MNASLLDPCHQDDEALPTTAIVVNDLTDQAERIDLQFVPGIDMTYNGYPTMEECMDHIDPSMRTNSQTVRSRYAVLLNACRDTEKAIRPPIVIIGQLGR
jgi:hypothetical protein